MRSNGYKIKIISGTQFRTEKVEVEKDVVLIKTARDYELNPYIPASALKGKLRSTLATCNRYLPQELILEIKKVFKLNLLNPTQRRTFINIIFGFSNQESYKNQKLSEKYQNCQVIILDGKLVPSSIHGNQLIEEKIEAYTKQDGRYIQTINERINRGLLFYQELIIKNYYLREEELISKVIDLSLEHISDYGYLGASGSKGYGRVSILKSDNDEI